MSERVTFATPQLFHINKKERIKFIAINKLNYSVHFNPLTLNGPLNSGSFITIIVSAVNLVRHVVAKKRPDSARQSRDSGRHEKEAQWPHIISRSADPLPTL